MLHRHRYSEREARAFARLEAATTHDQDPPPETITRPKRVAVGQARLRGSVSVESVGFAGEKWMRATGADRVPLPNPGYALPCEPYAGVSGLRLSAGLH